MFYFFRGENISSISYCKVLFLTGKESDGALGQGGPKCVEGMSFYSSFN